jgi:carbonic anhydrase
MDNNRIMKLLSIFGSIVMMILVLFFLGRSNQFSEGYFIWVFLILGLGITVVSLVYNAWAGKKRKEALQQTAAEMGYSFLPEDKEFNAQLTASDPFEILTKGRNHKAYNILRGQKRDAQAALFDYKYITGSGRSSQTHRLTLVLLTLEQAELVPLTLRGRGFFDKVAAKFGQKEISIEPTSEFSKKYLVKGSDEEAVRRLFSPTVLSLFEQQNNLACEASGKQLLVYRPDRNVKPEDTRAFLDNAAQLLELMRRPAYDFDYAR